ncbi:hypothetical protein BGX31_010235 [Mortierella sp. GBA43]|nr:hypothetical protein BGX31_010235 [Mortierella sp. GBA43]
MRLELFVFKPVSDIGLWDKLLGYQHLKELSLTSIWVAAMNVDVFWQLCARLQRVDFSNLMLESRGSLASMEFPLIKEVHLRRGNELVSFDFILRCPELVSCHWIAASKTISQLRPGFVEQYAMMKWPNLHTLDLHFDEGFTEDDLIKIFGGQQRINSLSVHCTPSSITPTSMASLRQRFGYLTTLAVTWPIDCNETSPMAQEILSSCPLLEELTAPRIDAAVIAQGQPWVCLWLKTLTLSIKFDPLTNHSIQPLVFNQLSRLERLRNVYLCTELRGDDHGLTRFQEAVDMRLDNGLGKLSTLRTLQSLDWGIASQRMGEQEIEWMLQHWRCLERVRGKAFNAQDHGLDKLLERRLQDDGVEVFRIG